MTLPDERYRAVKQAEQFLQDLLNPKKTPRVPKEIRVRAYSVLKHYPSAWDMDRVATACPEVFETRNQVEPLYKMVREHQERMQDPETVNALGDLRE